MPFIKKSLIFLMLAVNFTTLAAQEKLNISIEEAVPARKSNMYYRPANSLIQYTGRIETKNVSLLRFWSPGAYVTAKFEGNFCEVFLNDEVLYGNFHNYIEVAIDQLLSDKSDKTLPAYETSPQPLPIHIGSELNPFPETLSAEWKKFNRTTMITYFYTRQNPKYY